MNFRDTPQIGKLVFSLAPYGLAIVFVIQSMRLGALLLSQLLLTVTPHNSCTTSQSTAILSGPILTDQERRSQMFVCAFLNTYCHCQNAL